MTDDDMIARFRMYSERFKQASVAGEVYFDTLEYIIRLRKERDEARREICRNEADDISMELGGAAIFAASVAKRRGWDCFKEAEDDR